MVSGAQTMNQLSELPIHPDILRRAAAFYELPWMVSGDFHFTDDYQEEKLSEYLYNIFKQMDAQLVIPYKSVRSELIDIPNGFRITRYYITQTPTFVRN
jgi:hypothetical protein